MEHHDSLPSVISSAILKELGAGNEPSLPTAPELPIAQPARPESSKLAEPAEPEVEDLRALKAPDPGLGPDAERARQMQ